MHGKRRFFWLLTSSLLFATAACTLLLDRDNVQCSTSGDCAKFAANATCEDNVCKLPDGGNVVVDGGQDVNQQPDVNQTPIDSSTPDADAGPNDSGPTFGFDGCFPGTPTTNEQFLNACTPAKCEPFDDCARLGICDGGLLGPNPPTGPAPPSTPAADSGAVQLCTDVAANAVNPNGGTGLQPVYVTGSSNFPPFIRSFAPVLAKSGYGVVWQTSNSCAGVDSAYNAFRADIDAGAPETSKQVMRERPGRTTQFYQADGTPVPCIIQGDVPVDVGESDIYAKTCQVNIGYDPTLVPSGSVGEYLGPILPMMFIVPSGSSQRVLSAAAGQAVFGRGAAPLTATDPLPYDTNDQFFIRASSTATNQIISRGIFVDPTKWWGVDKGTATVMAEQMKAVPFALHEKTIGIISADFADSERGNITTLAFQSKGQACGFWPDSTDQAFDKANVRDGHYSLWGPIHFFTKLSSGVPASPAAQAFVVRFSATKLDQELVQSMAKSHVIPACAMSVTRDAEMGPIRKFDPPYNCDCFFNKEATGVAEPKDKTGQPCKSCTGPQDCTNPARPACNYGFCEPR